MSSSTRQFLDRHQRRREQGVPTVSVLLGDRDGARSSWKRWLANEERDGTEAEAVTLKKIVRSWMSGVPKEALLHGALAHYAQPEQSQEQVRSALLARSKRDRDLFCAEVDAGAAPSVALMARATIEAHCCEGLERTERVLEYIDVEAWQEIVSGVASLLPSGQQPGLFLIAPLEDEPLGWFAAAGTHLVCLGERAPSIPLAMTTSQEIYERYVCRDGALRVAAVLREGCVAVERPVMADRVDSLRPTFAKSLQRLEQIVVDERVLTSFLDAADAVTASDHDRARSAAEQFLFGVLEAMAVTAGRFRLNQLLPGIDQRIEVDLLCDSLRIAVEIDGYYHFTDREAYRRDRRKDLSLQCHGYIVARFLAEDVVRSLEAILDTILDLIDRAEQRT